ncbi:MAG: rhodanese-like domain-containing protein [Candidatus Altiarchaeota archaeon]|nr:rhodanese-like domain-containing protein [Candidatus Altiarchaeota archaeon]
MKTRNILLATLMVSMLSASMNSQTNPTITIITNSIDLPLAQGYIETYKTAGYIVQTITAKQLPEHQNDPTILILGGQNAPEGIGEITGKIMNEREKQQAISRPDASVLVNAPNYWTEKQRVLIFAGYGKEQTRKLFGDSQGDLLKTLRFNDNALPENTTTAPTVEAPQIDPTQPYTEIDAQQANALIQTTPGLTIIDVRGVPLYQAGHIPGAINLPEREFESALGTMDKQATYLIYCGGNSQSIRVSTIMSQNGYTRIFRLVDGYMAWRKAGYPRAK